MAVRSRCTLIGLVAAVLLGGCSNDNIYEADALEEAVVASQEDLAEELTVGSATCPDDVVLEEGVTVECTIDLEGVDAPYSVTLTNVESQDVAVTVEPLRTVIQTEDVAQYVTDNLQGEVVDADVVCGEQVPVILAETGDTITCTVGLGSQTRDVQLEVVDSDGTVEIVD